MPELSRCAYCRKHPVDPRYRPFCSERCRLLDLASWVDGRYRVPGESVAPDPDDPAPADEG